MVLNPSSHATRPHPHARTALPAGYQLSLPGRGSTYVTDTAGPPGAPALLLLHGAGCTGLLTWHGSIAALAEHFRVVTMDQRGHGDGIADPGFSLHDCADDAACVIEQLDLAGASGVIVVGHSMGSLVAQRVWRQHPHLVSGLVLCSTTDRFRSSPRQSLFFTTLDVSAAAGRWVPRAWPSPRSLCSYATRPDPAPRPTRAWMVKEWRKTEARVVAQAVVACGRHHSAPWLDQIDVPTAVVVTTRDRAVRPEQQRGLAARIPGATVHEVDAGHTSCITDPEAFVPVVLEAARTTAARVGVGAQ